jgi:hypothetical protein
MVVVLPTSAGPPIILAASDIENVIDLPTSAGDTPGGTPMAFIASERGMVASASGRSGLAPATGALGLTVVTAWAGDGDEGSATAFPGIGVLEAASCVTRASRGVEGITTTFTLWDLFTPASNA